MFSRYQISACAIVSVFILTLTVTNLGRGQDSLSEAEQADAFPRKDAQRVTEEEARRQAETLHTAMHITLQLVHHRFYREDEGLPIPAATLDEVFEELEDERQVKLRWLVVEGQAMNTDNKPQDEFEHDAVAALKAGKTSHEDIANGMYRRAAAITLTNHCLKCHVPDRRDTKNRTAGLIIHIPVKQDGK